MPRAMKLDLALLALNGHQPSWPTSFAKQVLDDDRQFDEQAQRAADDPLDMTDSGGADDPSAMPAENVAKLQMQVDRDSAEFGQGMKRLEDASDSQHALGAQLHDTWTKGIQSLEDSCLKLRDDLEKVAEIRGSCERAQTDAVNGLPNLFEARATDPERFSRGLGKIAGCAKDEGEDVDPTQPPASTECTCTEGSEEIGCSDAKDISDHELLCSRIVDKKVIDIQALSAFKEGGVCHFDRNDELLRPLMRLSDLPSVRRAGVGPFALAAFLTQFPAAAYRSDAVVSQVHNDGERRRRGANSEPMKNFLFAEDSAKPTYAIK